MPQLLPPLRWYHLIPATLTTLIVFGATVLMAYFLVPPIWVGGAVLFVLLLWTMSRDHVPIGSHSRLILEAELAEEKLPLPPTVSPQMARFASHHGPATFIFGALAVLSTIAYMIAWFFCDTLKAAPKIHLLGYSKLFWLPHLLWAVFGFVGAVRESALRKIEDRFRELARSTG